MVLREYFKILTRSLWLMIPLMLLSLTATLYFSFSRQPIYEAHVSYVIVFGASGSLDTADQYYVLDTLLGRQQIGMNFCSMITAGDNISQSLDALGITPQMIENGIVEIEKYKWQCNLIPDSNILEVNVQGTSPVIVERLLTLMGAFGRLRAESAYGGLLTIDTIDSPFLVPDPISPNHIQNTALGLVLGVIVSLTGALILDYLRNPMEKLEGAAIRDPLTNAYNDRYFQKRLAEEIERSRQRNRPISVAVMELQVNEDFALLPGGIRDELVHQAALYIEDKSQPGDIVAYRGDMLFEILLPETPGYEARTRLMVIHAALRSHLFRSDLATTSFDSKIGIVESGGDALATVDLLKQSQIALNKAKATRARPVHLVSTLSSAFVIDEALEAELALDMDNTLPEGELDLRVDRVKPDAQKSSGGIGRFRDLFSSSKDADKSGQKSSNGQQKALIDATEEMDLVSSDAEFDLEGQLGLTSANQASFEKRQEQVNEDTAATDIFDEQYSSIQTSAPYDFFDADDEEVNGEADTALEEQLGLSSRSSDSPPLEAEEVDEDVVDEMIAMMSDTDTDEIPVVNLDEQLGLQANTSQDDDLDDLYNPSEELFETLDLNLFNNQSTSSSAHDDDDDNHVIVTPYYDPDTEDGDDPTPTPDADEREEKVDTSRLLDPDKYDREEGD